MNQCKLFGQIYSLMVTPVIMGSGMKEENTCRTIIISNMIKLYKIHAGPQGGSDGMTKEH